MNINNGDKIEVETLFAEGKQSEAFKKIRLIRMRSDKYDVESEIWLNHKLAFYHYKITKDEKMCNYYLDLNKDIFEDNNERVSRLDIYYKWLWLYTEAKKSYLSKDEYCSNFIKLYQYYNTIGSERFSNGSLLNIVMRQGDEDEITEFMKEMIIEYGVNNDMVKDMFTDCKNFSNSLYIRVKDIFNFYSLKEDKDII